MPILANKITTKPLIALMLLFSFNSCQMKKQMDFFTYFSQYCGQKFIGESVFPENLGEDFAGKTLVMSLAECSDSEIRVPFQVGENTSRTWIITRTNQGLLLKHDHRHADGTADEITMYGGYENQFSTKTAVNFVADDATAAMLPEAKTNVWSLSFDQPNKQFIYALSRHGKPRYKAVFSLTN